MTLPESIQVFERGWLSSNNVLLVDDTCAALVDTGYATHAPQTLALVQASARRAAARSDRQHASAFGPLRRQRAAAVGVAVPHGDSRIRSRRGARLGRSRLTFRATGQTCERFTFTETIAPGAHLRSARSTGKCSAHPATIRIR